MKKCCTVHIPCVCNGDNKSEIHVTYTTVLLSSTDFQYSFFFSRGVSKESTVHLFCNFLTEWLLASQEGLCSMELVYESLIRSYTRPKR
jgi:hypothetical protein